MASAVASKGVGLAAHVKELPAVALKDVPLASLVRELPVVVAPPVAGKSAASTRRLLNLTKGAPSRRDDDDADNATEKSSALDHSDTADNLRRALDLSVPKLLSTDMLDLYGGEPTKLSHMLALMEDGSAAFGTGFSARGWCVSKEDDEALQLKVAMPGLGKEHIKVSVEKNILVIKGEGDKDPEDGDDKALVRYSRRFQLPAEAVKVDQIKAEMNNGVLKVTVPKIKDKEPKDVFQIKVE